MLGRVDRWSPLGAGTDREDHKRIGTEVEPRVKLCVTNEESFPIPLQYIDVVRRTNTTLDVLLESRMDDKWNVNGDQNLSKPWTGFTQCSQY